MIRKFILISLAWCIANLSFATSVAERADDPERGPTLHYTVSIDDPAAEEVRVTLRLSNIEPNTDSIRWQLPQGFAFVRLPEPLISDPIRATAGDRALEIKRLNPYEWELPAPATSEISLQYRVPQTHRALEAVRQRDAYEYPYLAADHGLLVTPTLFLFPTNASPATIQVDFELPENWPVIAPWDSTAARSFRPRNIQELSHDLIAVGHWSCHAGRIGDFQVVIAIAPGQAALEGSVVEPIRQIVEYELELFGREPRGRYLFVFGRPDMDGLAGSPKTNSMTLSVEPRLAAGVSGYLGHLIAHEFFHTWTTGLEIPDELRWYNEGFTDYFAHLIPARLGLNMRQSFAETLGDKMASCAGNPQRGKLSLVEAGGSAFFTDRDAYNLVYDGGLLLAAWLDQAIRKQHPDRKLDDLMRAFNNDPRRRASDPRPTLADFLVRVTEFTDEPVAKRFERFVRAPYDFDPISAFKELGIEVRREEKPADLSLRANLDGTRLIDIDPRSAAFRIGLRADDRVLKVNGQEVGDANALRKAWREPRNDRIEVLLRRGEREITIDQPIPNETQFVVSGEYWR